MRIQLLVSGCGCGLSAAVLQCRLSIILPADGMSALTDLWKGLWIFEVIQFHGQGSFFRSIREMKTHHLEDLQLLIWFFWCWDIESELIFVVFFLYEVLASDFCTLLRGIFSIMKLTGGKKTSNHKLCLWLQIWDYDQSRATAEMRKGFEDVIFGFYHHNLMSHWFC